MLIFILIITLLLLTTLGFVLVPIIKRDSFKQRSALLAAISSNKIIILLLFLTIISSAFIYWHFGSVTEYLAVRKAEQHAILIQKEINKMGSVNQIIATMEAHLQKDPSSAKGWFLLGRLYLTNNQYDKAVVAYTKANQLEPDNADTMIQLAEALFFQNNQKLSAQGQQLLMNALNFHPNDSNALNLLALDAMQKHRYEQAVHYWQTILANLDPRSQDAATIQSMLEQAQKKMMSVNVKSDDLTIPVKVKLAAIFQNKIQSNDTVFIYVQAVKGNPMPIIAIRRSASELPFTISLNDSMSMAATSSLSDHNQVRIIARVSKSGQAIPQSGDLQGTSAIIDPHDVKKTIELTIDKKIS